MSMKSGAFSSSSVAMVAFHSVDMRSHGPNHAIALKMNNQQEKDKELRRLKKTEFEGLLPCVGVKKSLKKLETQKEIKEDIQTELNQVCEEKKSQLQNLLKLLRNLLTDDVVDKLADILAKAKPQDTRPKQKVIIDISKEFREIIKKEKGCLFVDLQDKKCHLVEGKNETYEKNIVENGWVRLCYEKDDAFGLGEWELKSKFDNKKDDGGDEAFTPLNIRWDHNSKEVPAGITRIITRAGEEFQLRSTLTSYKPPKFVNKHTVIEAPNGFVVDSFFRGNINKSFEDVNPENIKCVVLESKTKRIELRCERPRYFTKAN